MLKYVLGPFVGEIGWELCYWQAWGRWLKSKLPELHMVAVTAPGRQAFYRDYADEIRFTTDKFRHRAGRLDCWGADGLNRARYFEYTEALCRRMGAFFAATVPMHIGDRFYIGNEFMKFRRFDPLPSSMISRGELPYPIVVLFPRHRKDNRDWGEENWNALCKKFTEEGYSVVIAGVKRQSCIADLGGERIINLVSLGSKMTDSLDLTLYYLSKARFAVGSQSFLPLLSLHQGVPTLMWGKEQQRHQVELNYFDTPCSFVYDPEYEIGVGALWERFEEFRDGLDGRGSERVLRSEGAEVWMHGEGPGLGQQEVSAAAVP